MPHEVHKQPHLYGLAAEFRSVHSIMAAAKKVHDAGYTCMEGYTPFPVEGLSELMGFKKTRLPLIVFCGGAFGAIGGFFMQWFANVIHLPWNIGGRPPNSWPAFIPITFEMTVLCAAFSAVLGMLALNKLPQPYHPLFNVDHFQFASRDRFFICIEATDPKFNLQETRQFLESLNPLAVMEVPL
jgi:hypothetical protein